MDNSTANKSADLEADIENLSTDKSVDQESGIGTLEMVFAGILVSFAVAGIAGNIAMVITYKKKNLKIRFDCLMLLLAIVDLMFLLLLINTLVLAVILGNIPWLFFLVECVFSGSVYTTTVISLERYLLLCRDK